MKCSANQKKGKPSLTSGIARAWHKKKILKRETMGIHVKYDPVVPIVSARYHYLYQEFSSA